MSLNRALSRGAVAALIAAVGFACSSENPEMGTGTEDSDLTVGKRDFTAHPAIVEIDDAEHVYAISDPHGHYDAIVRLLAANKLVANVHSDPAKVKWTGGTATLVIAGDIIDKGPQSLEMIDLLRSLEAQAPRSGGRVVTTMGNHEAEFLDDPHNDKAESTGQDEDGISPQLESRGIKPKTVAAGKDAEGRGKWLINLPLGVRVKKWFFAHGGDTQKLSLQDLDAKLEKSLKNNGFGDKDITGNDSILQRQKWYGNHKADNAGENEVEALGRVEHIVFGHDPGAFDDRGQIRQSKNGLLVKLDVAVGLHNASAANPAFMLHVSTKGKDAAEVLDSDGKSSPLE